jgi:hypothetical protein
MSTVGKELELLVSGEGMGSESRVLRVGGEATARDVLEGARQHGIIPFEVEEVSLYVEDGDDELELDIVLVEVGIGHRHHVHIHRSKWIEVTVRYGEEECEHRFRPAATVRKVKRWAIEQFTPTECDDPDTLRLAGSDTQLSDDIHIGTLVAHEHGKLSLELFTAERDIHYMVGDEPQVTRERGMTAAEILQEAFKGTDENPANYYLKDITDPNDEDSYIDRPNATICMRDGKRFLAIFAGPTPVS